MNTTATQPVPERNGTLRVLTFATLFPSANRPRHGVFVEQRLRQLVRTGEISARVICPVPWFPSSITRFGRYADFARVPLDETRYGVPVLYPRFPVLPKFGMSIAPSLMVAAMTPVLRRQIQSGFDFDLIDAHYFYPEGVAAVRIGRRLGRPVVVTARGSDINVFPRYALPRRQIVRAARNSKRVITVSRALKDRLSELGVPEDHVVVLPNGVDLDMFSPLDRLEVRRQLNLSGVVVLSVGNLIESKGHHYAIRALKWLPDATLVIVGEGKLRPKLERLAQDAQVAQRVVFTGDVRHEQTKLYYNAADVLVLASSREGMPNVVIEALACGCPVVATRVGGIPEVVSEADCGVLIDDRDPETVARGIQAVLERFRERHAIRRYAERFGWRDTARRQLDLFREVVATR